MNIPGATAQKAEAPDIHQRHQLGFNATESIRLFEKESDEAYTLHYRLKLNSLTSFRSGINYHLDTGGNGMLDLDIKAGLDKEFKQSGNWRFYVGSDISAGVEKLSNSSRRNYKAGLIPFLGILFHIDEHLSVSTEPGLLMEIRRFKNRDTFNPANSDVWLKMNFVHVGQILINLHF